MKEVKQVIVMRTDLGMRRGKELAQGGHASMEFLRKQCFNSTQVGPNQHQVTLTLTDDQLAWLQGRHGKIAVGCPSLDDLEDLVDQASQAGVDVHVVEDAGLTEFGGVPTITCAAFGPVSGDVIDPITGHLKLR